MPHIMPPIDAEALKAHQASEEIAEQSAVQEALQHVREEQRKELEQRERIEMKMKSEIEILKRRLKETDATFKEEEEKRLQQMIRKAMRRYFQNTTQRCLETWKGFHARMRRVKRAMAQFQMNLTARCYDQWKENTEETKRNKKENMKRDASVGTRNGGRDESCQTIGLIHANRNGDTTTVWCQDSLASLVSLSGADSPALPRDRSVMSLSDDSLLHTSDEEERERIEELEEEAVGSRS
jgi:hypothetical protein